MQHPDDDGDDDDEEEEEEEAEEEKEEDDDDDDSGGGDDGETPGLGRAPTPTDLASAFIPNGVLRLRCDDAVEEIERFRELPSPAHTHTHTHRQGECRKGGCADRGTPGATLTEDSRGCSSPSSIIPP